MSAASRCRIQISGCRPEPVLWRKTLFLYHQPHRCILSLSPSPAPSLALPLKLEVGLMMRWSRLPLTAGGPVLLQPERCAAASHIQSFSSNANEADWRYRSQRQAWGKGQMTSLFSNEGPVREGFCPRPSTSPAVGKRTVFKKMIMSSINHPVIYL